VLDYTRSHSVRQEEMKLIEEHKHIYNLQKKAAGPPALCEERGFHSNLTISPCRRSVTAQLGHRPAAWKPGTGNRTLIFLFLLLKLTITSEAV